jgi:hypothetical protein
MHPTHGAAACDAVPTSFVPRRLAGLATTASLRPGTTRTEGIADSVDGRLPVNSAISLRLVPSRLCPTAFQQFFELRVCASAAL